jgi:hypothetical protein
VELLRTSGANRQIASPIIWEERQLPDNMFCVTVTRDRKCCPLLEERESTSQPVVSGSATRTMATADTNCQLTDYNGAAMPHTNRTSDHIKNNSLTAGTIGVTNGITCLSILA